MIRGSSNHTLQARDWLLASIPASPDPSVWNDLLPFVRETGLAGRLANRVRQAGLCVPPRVQGHLDAAWRIAAKHEATLDWEIQQVGAALAGLDVPVVLLKGAGYQARGLPASLGRYSSDVDIMVPRGRLSDVERALFLSGWRTAQPDEYDQRYFRQWMHEVPPLRHELRNTVLDLHHTILPPTSRYNDNLDPALLFAASVPVDVRGLATLSDVDMVLHSAAHRFTEGEHPFALRDLIDVHDLLDHFSETDPAFWYRLVQRAEVLGLGRPLFYVLRYCNRLLGTEIPSQVGGAVQRFAPGPFACEVMDALVARSFLPGEDGPTRVLSDGLLYVRGHYLRMPWRLLIPHLARKWFGRHLPGGAPGQSVGDR